MDESVIKYFDTDKCDRESDLSLKRLSQAIRFGSLMREQCEGGPFVGEKSCAIGAAYEALGGEPDAVVDDTTEAWEFVCGKLGLPPYGAIAGWDGWSLCEEIFDRNDHQKMRREEIAAWLEEQGL